MSSIQIAPRLGVRGEETRVNRHNGGLWRTASSCTGAREDTSTARTARVLWAHGTRVDMLVTV